jgi:hypothetical protein
LATALQRTLKMIRLYLTKSEVEICTHVGKYRHAVTSQMGQERKQDTRQNGLQLSVNGVITEYAVAKALNLHFDLNCDFRKFGADLISQKGNTIDVKSTEKHGGNLNAVFWSNSKPADVFILTEIHNSYIGLIGWIDRENFLRQDNVRDVGNGNFYSMPQSQLFSLDDWVKVR